MSLKGKKIGIAMCGSICTLYLIQFNGSPLRRTGWVQIAKYLYRVGAF